MTQQVFAQFIETSPATLSSIFTGRTNPSLNIVEAIKRKIPDISTDWLMFGSGSMYSSTGNTEADAGASAQGAQPSLFDMPSAPSSAPAGSAAPQGSAGIPRGSAASPGGYNGAPYGTAGRLFHPESAHEMARMADKAPRKVVEIRVFYDDQTWESFAPGKSK